MAWLEDQFLEVAAGLFHVHREAGQSAPQGLQRKKSSTRGRDLSAFCLRGKDYMDSFSGGQIHLEEVANEACLFPVSLSPVVSGSFFARPRISIFSASALLMLDASWRAVNNKRHQTSVWKLGSRASLSLQRTFPAQTSDVRPANTVRGCVRFANRHLPQPPKKGAAVRWGTLVLEILCCACPGKYCKK